MLNVIKYEDLRDIVLIGHSYGGMVATGVADRARDKVRQLIYVDAFVPRRRPVAARSERAGAAADAGAGEDPATAGACRRIRRRRIRRRPTSNGSSTRRVDMPIKCFEAKLKLQGGPLTLPRSYIYATRITPADTFGPFAEQAKSDPAWRYHEIDASHSPNVTAPEALMALLQKIVPESFER